MTSSARNYLTSTNHHKCVLRRFLLLQTMIKIGLPSPYYCGNKHKNKYSQIEHLLFMKSVEIKINMEWNN